VFYQQAVASQPDSALKIYQCSPKQSPSASDGPGFLGGSIEIFDEPYHFEPSSDLVGAAQPGRIVIGESMSENNPFVETLRKKYGGSKEFSVRSLIQNYWHHGLDLESVEGLVGPLVKGSTSEEYPIQGSTLEPKDRLLEERFPSLDQSEVLAIEPFEPDDLFHDFEGSFLNQLLSGQGQQLYDSFTGYQGSFEQKLAGFLKDIDDYKITQDVQKELLNDRDFWFEFSFSYRGFLFIPKVGDSENYLESYPESFEGLLFLRGGAGDPNSNPISEHWQSQEISVKMDCEQTSDTVEEILMGATALYSSVIESDETVGEIVRDPGDSASVEDDELYPAAAGAQQARNLFNRNFINKNLMSADLVSDLLLAAARIQKYRARISTTEKWKLMAMGSILFFVKPLISWWTKSPVGTVSSSGLFPFLFMNGQSNSQKIPLSVHPKISLNQLTDLTTKIQEQKKGAFDELSPDEIHYLLKVDQEISDHLISEYKSHCPNGTESPRCL